MSPLQHFRAVLAMQGTSASSSKKETGEEIGRMWNRETHNLMCAIEVEWTLTIYRKVFTGYWILEQTMDNKQQQQQQEKYGEWLHKQLTERLSSERLSVCPERLVFYKFCVVPKLYAPPTPVPICEVKHL
jgi:hypothetical protein